MKKNRKTIRLKHYDYSQEGMYFVTICTHQHKCLFGEIVGGEMELNDAGRVVEKYWNEISEHFSYVQLDKFIIMPNHMHGIICVGAPIYGARKDKSARNDKGAMNRARTGWKCGWQNGKKSPKTVGAPIYGAQNEKAPKTAWASIYGAQNDKSAQKDKGTINRARTGGFAGNDNPMGKKSLGEIMRWYKGRCTFEINKLQTKNFVWQRNYYEHIIRDENDLNRIREYIINNPSNWHKDKYNMAGRPKP